MKGILKNLHRYVLWAIVSCVFWAFVISRITDAPAARKLILYADLDAMDRPGLVAALEEEMPETIRFVEPLLFVDAMFEPASVTKGDMFVVSEAQAEGVLQDLAVIDKAAFPGQRFYEFDGKAYGILLYDEGQGVRIATKYLAYEPGETYYLFFNAKSGHIAHIADCLGRTWQCGTIQLDSQLPERFELEYVGADGEKHRPIMIHRVVFGSIERFIGVITEHFAGAFPTWLAPVQVKVLPLTDRTLAVSKDIADQLDKAGVRVEVDDRNEKLGYKIREAQMMKVPYMLVIGDRDVGASPSPKPPGR